MGEVIKQRWLVVHPQSLLWALEEVEKGRSATDVMVQILDLADESMEDTTSDE